MTTAPITRPVLRYHGGKWRLAPWIISHFPPHRVYTEVFGGAASVLMHKPRSYAEVYNDAWGVVVNVFQVLRDQYQARELERRLRLTPFSRTEYEQTGDGYLAGIDDPIERARRTIFRSFAGFGSAATNAEFATGFRKTTSMNRFQLPAHDWVNYPNHIKAFTERLQGVIIESRPAIEVLTYHDTPDTLHYVDPPYVHATRNMQRGNAVYAYELVDDDHRELAAVLREPEGMVVLSGYPSELYDVELYPDWQRIERPAYGDGATARTEVLWLSPNCQAGQMHLFEERARC